MNSKEKIHIDSSEIKHPNGFHSDQLGFTFRWKGHFLRGIHPQSEDIAKRYFECGFIDEICCKGLFPKTWISEFENEEFAFIIEHEMMTPLLYATEWNFAMLRDAAVLVLEIAKIAKKYGYNMVDCHKLNVMFKCGKPMYVDLGSFIINEEGTTAWKPYLSFLRSYYYILDIWHSGAGQIAKRSMTPGVEFSPKDYHLYKNPIWRLFPRVMVKYYSFIDAIHGFAATTNNNIISKTKGKSKAIKSASVLLKKTVNAIKPIRSQRQVSLNRLSRKISRMNIGNAKLVEDSELNRRMVNAVNSYAKGASATIFETDSITLLKELLAGTCLQEIIAVHEKDVLSDTIYSQVQKRNLSVTCTYYQISEGGLLIRGRFPEDRLKSDIVIAANYVLTESLRGVKSALWFVQERMQYSRQGKMIMIVPTNRVDLIETLKRQYKVETVTMSDNRSCLIIEKK